MGCDFTADEILEVAVRIGTNGATFTANRQQPNLRASSVLSWSNWQRWRIIIRQPLTK